MAEGVPQAAAGPSWIGDALNGEARWALRRRIPVLLGLMMLFDSWDSIAIAYTLPSIGAEWHLSPLQAGWLVSAGYAGQFVGAIGFGAIGEKWGRLPALKLLVIAMGLLALFCAAAGNYDQLFALRLAQGLAIGGGLPVATCYINEIAPTATRGRFFGTFQFFMVSGFGIASLSSAVIVPHLGWRAVFAFGALPLLIVPFLYRIPESPRWLAARGRSREAAEALGRLGAATLPVVLDEAVFGLAPPRVPVADLLAPGLRRRTLVTGLLWFFISLVSFGLSTWIPSIYVSIFHIPVARALSYNTIAALSIFLLPILLRQSIDRIGRRPPVIAGTAIGGVALLAMTVIPASALPLLIGVSVIGQIGISTGSMVLWPYTAETYETRIRSVALGIFASLARAASTLTPLLVGGVIQTTGSVTIVFWVFGLSSLGVAALWLFCTQETAGREIDG